MGKSNDNINKIDEQIQSLIDEEKEIYEDKSLDEHEVIIDRKYEYDNSSESVGDTKKIDVIDDIEVNNIEDENTKKLDNIDNIDSGDSKENVETFESSEEVADKNDDEIESSESINDNSVENAIDDDFSDVKKGNGTIWIVLSFLAVFIFLVAFILFMFFGNNKNEPVKNDNTVKDTLTKNEQKEIIKKYGDALTGVIALNIEKDNKLLSYNEAIKLIDFDYKVECNVHEIYNDGNIYLNKCKIDDLKTTYSYGEKQEEKKDDIVVEDDESIKVYVSKKNGNASFNEPKNVDDYDVYKFNIDGKYSDLTLLGIDSDFVFYYDEDYNVQMINYKKNKKALSPMNYTSILPIGYDGLYDNSVVAVKVNGKWGFYNLNTRERIVAHKYDDVALNINSCVSGPPLFINAIEKGKVAVIEDGDYGVINYNNGSQIIPVIYTNIVRSGNYLWAIDDANVGHIFDYAGKEYLSGTFDDIYGIVDGSYVLVKDGSELKLIKVNGKVYYNYGNVLYGNYNFGMKYNDGAIFQFYKDDSNNNCIEFIYDNSNKTGEVKDIQCGAVDISK